MEDNETISKEDFLKIFDESLHSGESKKALDALQNPKYAVHLEVSIWDIFPKIAERYGHSDGKIAGCAQQILLALVQHANPEEMLLELIEKAEDAKTDNTFIALLRSMQPVLLRMPEKRERSLQWCLNAITHYSTSESADNESDESEEETESEDDNVDKPDHRALKLYRAALEFCKPFIEEISLTQPVEMLNKLVSAQRERQQKVLVTFLIQAFSKAVANADIHYDGKTKTPFRLLAEDLVNAVCHLCSDAFYFLTLMEERSSQRKKKDDTHETWEDIDPFLFEDLTPNAGLGTLYHMILVEGVREEYAPSVYSPLFIMQNILHVVVALVARSEDRAMLKGLEIAQKVLQRLGRPPVSSAILDDPVHSKFCKSVMRAVFRSASERTARLAVAVFRTYLKSFGQKGQYQVLKNLFAALEEPGPRGFLVTQLKDTIDRSLKEHSSEEDVCLFRGPSLFRLIVSLCSLPDGSETDVAVHADHILSTLNLMWYLALRKDSKTSGVSERLEWFEDNLMEPLGEAVGRCRNEYEQQKADLSQQPGSDETAKERLDEDAFLDRQEKLLAVETTLNKLMLIEKLLADVDFAMNAWRDE